MRERLRISPPPRERRSHAERTAETRARIKEAVVASIAKVGFQRTTAAEISRRAGLTWGAVQHHFGDKNGILAAVLEDSFNRFADRLAEVATRDLSLADRVDLFVDRAWEHFGSAHYRSTFEILLNYPAPEGAGDQESLWQSDMLRAWNGIWQRFFGDARLAPRRRLTLQYYAISVLSGIASLQMLGTAASGVRSAELELLKDTLRRELAGASS